MKLAGAHDFFENVNVGNNQRKVRNGNKMNVSFIYVQDKLQFRRDRRVFVIFLFYIFGLAVLILFSSFSVTRYSHSLSFKSFPSIIEISKSIKSLMKWNGITQETATQHLYNSFMLSSSSSSEIDDPHFLFLS